MKKALLPILALVLMMISCAGPANTDSTGYWPGEEWRASSPEEQGMDSAVLAGMYGAITQSGKQVDSVMIIRNGYVVNEAYFFPYRKGLKHAMNSVTKSLLSATAGMAADRGKLSMDDTVLTYFPGTANVDARKEAMGIGDLMSMETGLDWGFVDNVSTNDMQGYGDWAQFTMDIPMKEDPGRTFLYCNGAAEVLSSIITDAMGKNAEKLFGGMKIGIDDMYWAISPQGTSQGYSGAFMEPADMARFGYLYLMDGNWDGRQVISPEWIEASTASHATPDWIPLLTGYGYFWWIPEFGGYCALGHGGNYIFVLPEYRMVAVFTGGIFDTRGMFFPLELMRDYVIPSIKSAGLLPEDPAGAEALENAVAGAENPPSPEPGNPLPETAARISGKTYAFEGTRDLKLTFGGGDTFTILEGGQYAYEVGLDGVYRVNDVRDSMGSLPDHNHRAFKGRWLDKKTLEVVSHELEDGYETVYTCVFEGDTVEITVDISAANGPFTLTGRIKE